MAKHSRTSTRRNKNDISVAIENSIPKELNEIATTDNAPGEFLAHLRDEILARHNICFAFGASGIKAMILCGEMLLLAKLVIGHGQFSKWIATNFQKETGLVIRTAQRYMAKTREFRTFLKDQGLQLPPALSVSPYLESAEFEKFIAPEDSVGNVPCHPTIVNALSRVLLRANAANNYERSTAGRLIADGLQSR